LTPAVTSNFGQRPGSAYQTASHFGVDFQAGIGTVIQPLFIGEIVISVNEDPQYGRQIRTSSSGFIIRYAHLSSFGTAQVGTVFTAQNMALTGSSGVSTGPHLHIDVSIRSDK